VAEEILKSLGAAGELSPLDIHFAQLMTRLSAGGEPELALAAALVSRATGQGHVCLDLQAVSKGTPDGLASTKLLPEPGEWCEKLRKSPVVGAPGDYRPLVLDDAGRLYLYRYWEYQQKLAYGLRAKMAEAPDAWETSTLRASLDSLFPSQGEEVDWQKVAAFAGVRNRFCVVSGGPGTGKTTTVARILALLVELTPSETLRMALAAPTGKAAARLQEAIQSAKANLHCTQEVKARIPETASTIHRLLGSITGSPYFRHNGANPLPLDVLVVDEASMVDLPLMSKLVEALTPQARLILLGDRDQLASVEAGAVLGDICQTGGKIVYSRDFAHACEEACGAPLGEAFLAEETQEQGRDCIIELQKSYRFSGESGIALFSSKVRQNDAEGAVALLRGGVHADLAWTEPGSCAHLERAVREHVTRGFRSYLEKVGELATPGREDPGRRLKEVFDAFEGLRILCALREGLCGVNALNRLAEEILKDEGLIGSGRKWYVGKPVLIRRNDYTLRLFNGDVGLYLPDILTGGEPRVFFPDPGGTFRSFHPQRLPEHETVWAMTVHKSQGSEFDEIILVLPDRESPVMSRELVYTAITRAREKVTLLGPEPVLRQSILRSTRRLSGLSDALWKDASSSAPRKSLAGASGNPSESSRP
jgi:exodeoxyribonuclease V alpha subunit